jgi:hypothetical protein
MHYFLGSIAYPAKRYIFTMLPERCGINQSQKED